MTLALTTFCCNLNQHKRYKKYQTLQRGNKNQSLSFPVQAQSRFSVTTQQQPRCLQLSLPHLYLGIHSLDFLLLGGLLQTSGGNSGGGQALQDRKTLPGVTDFRALPQGQRQSFSLFLSNLGTELLGIHKTRRTTKWQCM